MINKYFISFMVILIVYIEEVFSSVVNAGEMADIPFKAEHTPLNDAASNIPYIFLLLVLFVVVFFIIGKKYGIFKKFNQSDADNDTISIVKTKRITTNTIFIHIKIKEKDYMFLESKNALCEIKPDLRDK